jgi:hypothetical protein
MTGAAEKTGTRRRKIGYFQNGNCGRTVQERHGIAEKNTVKIAPEREDV